MTYIFYDIETTGSNTAFDQILQFAAIKTDEELVELDRFNIRCRLLPHVIPSPSALRVNRITPAILTDPDLPSHYEAVRQIRSKLLEWSPAIFIGYNSIKFDEELLRQAFFQTLQEAFLTNTNGNTRADVMRIAHATSIYSPEALTIPLNDSGVQTFRLDKLAPSNGYNYVEAHEAMADIEATIFIARIIRDRAPEIWNAMKRTTSKNGVKSYLDEHPMFSLSERYFGRPFSWLVTVCGHNPVNQSEFAVFDLYYNPEEYISKSIQELIEILNSKEKPIRSMRVNSQPIIMPGKLAPLGVKALSVPPDELSQRVALISQNRDFQIRIGQAQALRFADYGSSPYVEKRIYDGFPKTADKKIMENFQEVDWMDRATIANEIEDSRLNEFAWRLIYFEHPDILPSTKLKELQAWHAERILTEDEAVPWMTIKKASREVDDLISNAIGDEADLLQEVKAYLYSLAEKFI